MAIIKIYTKPKEKFILRAIEQVNRYFTKNPHYESAEMQMPWSSIYFVKKTELNKM